MAEDLSGGRRVQVVSDRVSALVVLAGGIGAFTMASGYQPGSTTFPMLASGVMILCAVALFVRSFRGSPHLFYEGVTASWAAAMLGLIFLTALYVVAIGYLGYTTATLVFVPLVAFACGLRSWAWIVGATLIFTFISSVMFIRVFHTQLPPDLLFKLY